MIGIIYKVTNLINNKCYIGQTIRNLDYRRKEHIKITKYHKENSIFHKAIRKHGIENFEWKILCECETSEILNIMETFMIMVHKSYKNQYGYNLTWGGDGSYGYNHSKETKKKLSESKKGEKNYFYGKKHLKETKKKISNSVSGKNNPMYGKYHSEKTRKQMSESKKGYKHAEETRKKIGEANKNRRISEETRKKMSESHRGKKHSEETKKKISNSVSSEKNGFYGKKHSEEMKKKISNNLKRNMI